MRARARPGRQRDSSTDDALPAAPVMLPNRLINLAAAGNAAVQRALAPADAFALATSGPAAPLPFRAEMEQELGHGFGHVRAHLGGPAAREGLGALGAVAATYGDSVAFAAEQPSRDVVAHEMAHVVQQDGVTLPDRPAGVSSPGSAAERDAAAASATAGSAPPGTIHRLVDTSGGRWRTTAYAALNTGRRIGAHIELHFTANDLVEAGQIGLAQTVKTLKSTTADGAADTPANARTMPDFLERGEGDVGRGIDRRDTPKGSTLPNTNPLYGVYNVPAAGGAAQQVSAALGDIGATGGSVTGAHRRKPDGTFAAAVDAVLNDTPGRTPAFAGQEWEQSFEVAALAVDGPLAGMYLGSVEWGWHTDDDGKARLDPATVQIVREGPPTEAFGDAAAKWNSLSFTDTATGASYDTVDLPIAHDIDMFGTRDLAGRVVEIRSEVAALPAGPDKVRRGFTLVAYERELGRRNIEVYVRVRSTEDWLGADHVYVRLTGDKKHRTAVKKLNDGDSHDFLVPLDAVAEKLPLSGPISIEVFDKDSPDGDDKIVSMEWDAPYRPMKNKASMDDAVYDVRVGYER